MLTEKALKEFEKIWREHNPGKEIERKDLTVLAERVIKAVTVVYSNK